MSLVRDIGFTVVAVQEGVLVTCAAAVDTGAASTAPAFPGTNTTADVITSTGGPLVVGGTSTVNSILFGRTINRLAAPLGAGYFGALPSAYAYATRGSTEADRRFQIGCKLQHGDSSGAGDMADYSTANQPAIRTYFSSARTTAMLSWELSGRSTGILAAASTPAYYDLTAAKQYIRLVVFAGKDRVTTESSGDEQARVGGTVTFIAGDSLPQEYALERNSPESTSTSTA